MNFNQFVDKYRKHIPLGQETIEWNKYIYTIKLFNNFESTFIKVFK